MEDFIIKLVKSSSSKFIPFFLGKNIDLVDLLTNFSNYYINIEEFFNNNSNYNRLVDGDKENLLTFLIKYINDGYNCGEIEDCSKQTKSESDQLLIAQPSNSNWSIVSVGDEGLSSVSSPSDTSCFLYNYKTFGQIKRFNTAEYKLPLNDLDQTCLQYLYDTNEDNNISFARHCVKKYKMNLSIIATTLENDLRSYFIYRFPGYIVHFVSGLFMMTFPKMQDDSPTGHHVLYSEIMGIRKRTRISMEKLELIPAWVKVYNKNEMDDGGMQDETGQKGLKRKRSSK